MRRPVLIIIAIGTVAIVGVIVFTLWRGVFLGTPAGFLELGIGGLGYTPAPQNWEIFLVPRELPMARADGALLPRFIQLHIGWVVECPWWLIVTAWTLVSLLAWRWSKPRKVAAAFEVEAKPE